MNDAPGGQRSALLKRLGAPPGLCERCRHLRLLESPRSAFVRCELARTDSRFPRYPSLPVLACSGFVVAGGAEDADA